MVYSEDHGDKKKWNILMGRGAEIQLATSLGGPNLWPVRFGRTRFWAHGTWQCVGNRFHSLQVFRGASNFPNASDSSRLWCHQEVGPPRMRNPAVPLTYPSQKAPKVLVTSRQAHIFRHVIVGQAGPGLLSSPDRSGPGMGPEIDSCEVNVILHHNYSNLWEMRATERKPHMLTHAA